MKRNAIERAAISWWRGKRGGMSDRDHLVHHGVNCTTDAEKRLARAVANALGSELRLSRARLLESVARSMASRTDASRT